MMHPYKIEVYENDVNGNPKSLMTTMVADDVDKAESYYMQYRNQYQTDEQGNPTGIRAYTPVLHVLTYKRIEKAHESYFPLYH